MTGERPPARRWAADTCTDLVAELTRAWEHDLDTAGSEKRRARELNGREPLLARLREHLEPGNTAPSGGGGKHGKVSGSPAPWAGEVATLLTDVAAGARHLERDLHEVLGWSSPQRSGSDLNTRRALSALPELVREVERTQPEHELVQGDPSRLRPGQHRPGRVERDLRSWHYRARVVLGAETPWARVPLPCTGRRWVDEEHPDVLCGQRALRQRPNDGAVVCRACGEVYTEDEVPWSTARLAHTTTTPTPEGEPTMAPQLSEHPNARTVWECEQPPPDVPYQVVDAVWNADRTERRVRRVALCTKEQA